MLILKYTLSAIISLQISLFSMWGNASESESQDKIEKNKKFGMEVNHFIAGLVRASSEEEIPKKASAIRVHISKHPHIWLRLMQGDSLRDLLESSAISNFSSDLVNTLNRNLEEPLLRIADILGNVPGLHHNYMVSSILKKDTLGLSQAALLRQVIFLDSIPDNLLACICDIFSESLMETKFSESNMIKYLVDPNTGINIKDLPQRLGSFFELVISKYFDSLLVEDRRNLILTCLDLSPNADIIEQISLILNNSGPVLQKSFQLLSQEIKSPFLTEVMHRLKNDVQAFPGEIARQKVEEALGKPLEDVFEIFNDVPIGAATIGQVHLGRLRQSHKEVVIKIKRPGIVAKARREFLTLRSLTKDPSILDFLTHLEESLNEEMDFLQEVDHLKEGSIYDGLDNGRIHSVKLLEECASTSEVIFMDRAKGKSLHKLKSYSSPLLKQKALGSLLHFWFKEAIFGSGFFHGDLHSGNIFLSEKLLNSQGDRDYEITLIDFGNVAKFSKLERKAIVKMMVAEAFQNSDLMYMGFDSILELTRDQRDILIPYIEELFRVKSKFITQEILDKLMFLNVTIPKNIVLFNRGRSFIEQQLEQANKQVAFENSGAQPIKPENLYRNIIRNCLLFDIWWTLGEAHGDNDAFMDNAVLSCIGTSLFWGYNLGSGVKAG